MKLTYIKQAGEPNGDAGDQYTGLDRFGRVVDQRWPQGEDELERVDYGFTAASNRQWRQNLVAATGQDEYYNYDGLYQVAELNRGTLNGTKTAITGTPSWTEDFTYDPIGNWDAYLTKVSGVTDLDQTRTHNTANETTEIDGSSTTVAHDLAGNMVKVPQVADWEATNELTWDAWNRLVEVVDGETTVAQYRYDGKTRRVSKEVDAVRHYYYSDQWQVVEERVDSETAAERQFVWGQRYLDDLVLRDRDVDHDGSLDERLYVLSDYFNPTAIADEDGVVVERYGYNAFGLSRVMDADFEPRSTSDYDWETRYGAYRWDGETGFYQVRYRYLHPTLGRWLSRDPIEEEKGINLFVYVNNSPIEKTDPSGQQATGNSLAATSPRAEMPQGTTAQYCQAKDKYPNNQWLKCVCSVSGQIILLVASLKTFTVPWVDKKEMNDKANWFLCMNSCMFQKWKTAFDLWESGGADEEHNAINSEWHKFVCDCSGEAASSKSCCEQQVRGEQQGFDDCTTQCGKYKTIAWGAPASPIPSALVNLFQSPGWDSSWNFNDYNKRVGYGISMCCKS